MKKKETTWSGGEREREKARLQRAWIYLPAGEQSIMFHIMAIFSSQTSLLLHSQLPCYSNFRLLLSAAAWLSYYDCGGTTTTPSTGVRWWQSPHDSSCSWACSSAAADSISLVKPIDSPAAIMHPGAPNPTCCVCFGIKTSTMIANPPGSSLIARNRPTDPCRCRAFSQSLAGTVVFF